MHLRFVLHASLPRLAWRARIRKGSDAVVVDHGPDVETRPGAFFEGAWDGPFEDDAIDQALTLAGSGGRIRGSGVVFAGPTQTMDRLYSLAAGDELFVSNSLPFLLATTGDAPDPAYADYFRDLCEHFVSGLADRHRTLPTARGNAVSLHTYCNLAVGSDLVLVREEKRAPEAPRAFEDYFAALDASVRSLLANAAHPARRRRYTPLVSVSRGYDSTAVAALAARAGCRTGFTFSNPAHPERDNGATIGQRLGLEMLEYDRLAFLALEAPEAEFHACPRGADVQLAAMETELAGSVLMLGRRLPGLWNRDEDGILPDLRRWTSVNLAGCTMNEFRLRVGFLHYNPGWFGSQNAKAIGDIARSSAMLPWSVGGNYDRPIARRIVEEAGVPREDFGRDNIGSAHYVAFGSRDLTPAAREDFESFYRALPRTPLEKGAVTLRWAAYQASRRTRRLANGVARSVGLSRRLPIQRLQYLNCRPEMLFTFHWGVERVSPRYRI